MMIFEKITKIFLWCLPALLMTGCVEALEEKTSDYGYIQLKIVKAPEVRG